VHGETSVARRVSTLVPYRPPLSTGIAVSFAVTAAFQLHPLDAEPMHHYGDAQDQGRRPGARRRPVPPFLTVNQSRRPNRAAPTATMVARRSTGASGTSSSIRWVCCSRSWYTQPTCKTATVRNSCSPTWATSSRGYATCGLIRPTPAHCSTGLRRRWAGAWRSSSAPLGAASRSGLTASSSASRCLPSSSPYPDAVVERALAWIGRHRRMSKDYERLPATSEALVYLTNIRLLLGRLTRSQE